MDPLLRWREISARATRWSTPRRRRAPCRGSRCLLVRRRQACSGYSEHGPRRRHGGGALAHGVCSSGALGRKPSALVASVAGLRIRSCCVLLESRRPIEASSERRAASIRASRLAICRRVPVVPVLRPGLSEQSSDAAERQSPAGGALLATLSRRRSRVCAAPGRVLRFRHGSIAPREDEVAA
jgi:hypothetical protein